MMCIGDGLGSRDACSRGEVEGTGTLTDRLLGLESLMPFACCSTLSLSYSRC